MKKLYILSFICLLLSCSKQDKETLQPAPPPGVINDTKIGDSTTLYGVITDDKGTPVKEVVVSDGFSSVKTDANGVYQIKRDKRAKFVFYSTPSNYKIAVDADNNPVFYQSIESVDKWIRKDFILTAQPVESKFTFLFVADPQCRNIQEVSRYRNETIPDINEIVPSLTNPYAMTLGDIVFDAPDLWSEMKASMSKQKVTFFQVIGNHDHLETAPNEEASAENFRHFFGPTDYSFNRGKTHVVAMDNVIYSGKQEYSGGITDAQLAWLEQDLSYVSDDYMVIFASHIPFRSGSRVNTNVHYNEVLQLLSRFSSAYIMTGHTHYPDKYIHEVNGKKIYEYIHGAACGAWWNSNVCADGTPNGYGVFEIENGKIVDEFYKATNYDRSFQIRAYDARQAFGPAGKFTYYYSAPVNLNLSGDGWIVANVWDADDSWTVELYQNGKSLGLMKRVTSRDYWATYYHMEELGKAVGSDFDKSENHFFEGRLNGDVSNANFEIIAKDKFGNVYRCNRLQTDYTGIASYVN
ncbi:calcineurin-like phosphoesterase C-terminal domain-containing protein [Arachidicoccus terrestris]|uniref:calcineurin-like phosphoesterase C-terminal domain-containing protein n=1 Tax=Arachidicoccus terrestris TaxID=2875539 RepID=UPI001CC71D47|nr:calcineurin-like phosphoesterase family protein [Arachidicoccus terrestris]UAY56953.1 calcineurin-like phosphoesterase family protein [Arachidicoccus terrestris]